jgi:hypothetical protein
MAAPDMAAPFRLPAAQVVVVLLAPMAAAVLAATAVALVTRHQVAAAMAVAAGVATVRRHTCPALAATITPATAAVRRSVALILMAAMLVTRVSMVAVVVEPSGTVTTIPTMLDKAALAATVLISAKPTLDRVAVAVVVPAGFSDLRGTAAMAAITVGAVGAVLYPVPAVPARQV